MTEGNAAAANGAAQAKPPAMQILGQYIRDLSFENLLARKGISGDLKPEVSVQVALDARKRTAENEYEVITKFLVRNTNKTDAAPLFVIELEYAGIFHVENVPQENLHPFLMIECPRMLFPFVRRIVSDVTRDGGFPQLNLDMVDFVSLYRQELARRAQEQTAEGAQTPPRTDA